MLLKPFYPPYYEDMEEAVLAFRAYKFAPGMGTFRDGGIATGWKDAAAVQAGMLNYPRRTIAATIACCHYVHRCYGRFPGSIGSFCTVLAHRAGAPCWHTRRTTWTRTSMIASITPRR